jgi:Shedu protein SduA, C-terminal
MSGTDWRSVAASLRIAISGPTPAQTEFARSIGLELDPSTPQAVATALMLWRLREPLGLPVSVEPNERQLDYLQDLAEQTDSPMPTDLADRTVADAWIAAMHDKRAAIHLEQLRPEPGDVVKIPPFAGHELRIIASIAPDGLLYLRGPGQRIRPHNAEMFARQSDPNYAEAKYAAEQQTAARIRNPAKATLKAVGELQEWRVPNRPDLTSYHTLEDALGSATDERPLQKVLEEHPEMLGHIVTGHHGTYVIPQASLGGQYVPDFLIAAETSNGLQWTLVEIESPNAPLTIADGQHSHQLRKAIQQIIDWREWLSDNAAYARQSKAENGLGLPGIRTDARALIIISRESLITTAGKNRARELGERNIEIRTYDWLLRASQHTKRLAIGLFDAETRVPDFLDEIY